MFSALRIIFIVGVIFYFSPVRNVSDGPARMSSPAGTSGTAAPSPEGPARLQALWDALPESARQSIVDRIASSAVDAAVGASKPVKLAAPTDTLEPEDLKPAWGGDPKRKH